MMVRDVSKLKVGRVAYSCWCDDDGKVIDDGTVSRLGETHFRVTAADPTLHWLHALSRGFDVTIEDSSARLAALALQGPTSRAILRDVSGGGGDAGLDALKFFGVTRATIAQAGRASRSGSAAPATPATWAMRSGSSARTRWRSGTP